MVDYVQLHDDGPGKRVACTLDGDGSYVQHVKSFISDGAGTANTKQLGTQLTTADVGLVTNTIIHGLCSTGHTNEYVDVKATHSGALLTDSTLSGGWSESKPYQVAGDTSGRFRVAQLTTLFDGKIYNAENTFKWDTKGTGTASYSANTINLSVTSSQYVIRQARSFSPYFSGKPQVIEITHSGFANESNVVKRFGYFSSNAVAPYDSSKDGWWIEADGTTYRLICSNLGTETHNIPWTSWDAYNDIDGYDWSKFTVVMVDFLWLGGAGLRLFLVVDGVFKLVHTIDNHAGYQSGIIFNNPNQPVRYEIRSSTGAGSFRAICSQVATEGTTGTNEQGEGLAIYTPKIACNSIGTVYALCGVRKVAAYRNHFVPLAEFGGANVLSTATPEAGILMLLLNPTLSAPLSWAANSRIETAIATTQTITNVGRIVKAVPVSGGSVQTNAPNAALRTLGVGIDNTMSELILAYTPLTSNQDFSGAMQILEY
jgi:hypothetical protein